MGMWWLTLVLRIGEVANPGPPILSKMVTPSELFYIESDNVTNLETHLPRVAGREVGVHYIQEHSAPEVKHGWMKKVFDKHGKQIHLSCLDQQAEHNLAGVATITTKRRALGVVEPKTDAF